MTAYRLFGCACWPRRTGRRRQTGRHIAADRPGDRWALDAFSVGKLKGVGKVWPLMACAAAASYGWARLAAGHVAAATMARLLGKVVRPAYRAAGGSRRRVLTENGKAFKGRFDEVCAAWHIRHTRTKPRHGCTTGFVERVQGTILHEHWRIAVRRPYFTSVPALQRSLDGFLRFSNTERSHRGYRLRGRTPITIVAGEVAA